MRTIQQVEELYLDYFNNFLSVDRFAEYYDLSYTIALKYIEIGRYYNHHKDMTVQRQSNSPVLFNEETDRDSCRELINSMLTGV